MCGRQRRDGRDEAIDLDYWQHRIEEIAARGQRVLAIARKEVQADKQDLAVGDVRDMDLLGLCGIIDPPREEAPVRGRTVYDNIKKAITFILPTNGGEAGIIIAAILSGTMLPITPVQILWVNMVTAVTLALALAFEPSEAGVMKRSPRSPEEPILSSFLIWRIVFVSLILVVGTFGLFLWDRQNGATIESARGIAVNTLVMFEVFYLLNCRHLRASVLSREGLFGNRYVLMSIGAVLTAQLIFTYLPLMQRLFGVAPLDLADWLRIVGVAASVFVLVEVEKQIMNGKDARDILWTEDAGMNPGCPFPTHAFQEASLQTENTGRSCNG